MPVEPIRKLLGKTNANCGAMLLLALSCGVFNVRCVAQQPSGSPCPNSTVADAWGVDFASEAKAFFVAIQGTVKAGDRRSFAALVRYPLHVHGKSAFEVKTAAEMIRNYTSIITPKARRASLDQRPDCLFANGQGVMAAGGRVWFQKQTDGKMKIIALNIVLGH